MRLKAEEIASIKKIILDFDASDSTIYFYGSRADDSLKGGDIDLLWVVSEASIQICMDNKYLILSKIKSEIGDQRIDLSIVTRKILSENSFYQGVFEGAIEL